MPDWARAQTPPVTPDGHVGTDRLQDGAVTTPKIADRAVTEAKLAQDVIDKRVAGDMLTATTIASSAALTNALNSQATSDEALRIHFTAAVTHSGTTYAEGQISYVAPRSRAIENEFVLPEGGITGVADGSITTAKLASQAVTREKLAFDAVGVRNLAADTVTSAKIVDNAITGNDIASNQIVTRHIVSQSIIRGLMAGDSVGSTELVDGDVAEGDLSAAVRAKLLPTLPANGSRDNKVPKFDGNTLGWEVDGGEGGGSARAFGSGSGQIATWAEGDSAARLPDAKSPASVESRLDRRDVFGTITVNPPGIPGRVFPEFMAVTLSNKLDSRTLAEIRVSLNGVPIGAVIGTSIGPFNGLVTLNGEQVGGTGGEEGGLINLAINAANRMNLANNITTAPQWITLELAYKFEGTSLVTTVPPDAIDRAAFAVNNNGYDPGRNPAFSGRILPSGGSDGQFLGRASGAPAWVAAPSGGGSSGPSLPAFPAEGSRDNKVPKFSGDTLAWEVDATGAAGAIGANSLLPSQAQADTAARQAAWRARFDSAKIDFGNTLPATTASNTGDVHIFTQNVSSGLSWRDFATGSTLTSAFAGDVASYFDRQGWTRVGNIIGNQNLLLDNAANPIAASAATEGKVLFRTGKFYQTVHFHHTDPSVTYRAFAATDLPNGYSWGGVTQVSPTASQQPDNRVIYSIPGQHFLRKVTAGFATWVIYTPPNWRGAWDSESQADAAVRAVGDIVYFGGTVRVASAYTARQPERYEWVQIEQYDLREVAGQIATPATGDRFFFSDENQAGDPLRYVQLATLSDLVNAASWRGDWAAGSYSVGDLSRRAGLPWLAVSDVTSSDPAPDALTNIKWLRLGAPSATETLSGTVEIATTAEMNAGSAVRVPDAAKVKAYVDAEVAAVNRVPRALTAATTTTVLSTYTVLSSDTQFMVELYNNSQASQGSHVQRHYQFPILRLQLSTTGKHFAADTRLPQDSSDDPNNRVIGFVASLSSNTLTISHNAASGNARYLGTITGVYAW